MAKGKLKFPAILAPRFQVAADLTEIKIGEKKKIGNDAFVEISYKNAQQVFECGQYMTSLTDADVKASIIVTKKS